MKELGVDVNLDEAQAADAEEVAKLKRELELMEVQKEFIRRRFMCKLCSSYDRNVSIAFPCGHVICANCSEDLDKKRKRTCPHCGQRFAPSSKLKLML